MNLMTTIPWPMWIFVAWPLGLGIWAVAGFPEFWRRKKL